MMQTAEITYRIGTYGTETTPLHIWEITDEHGVAAALYVSLDNREVMNVETREDRQREGLASALFRAADAQIGVFHAPESHRTFEGDRFARSVGGDSLPCLHGCCDTDTDEDDLY